MRGGGSIIQHTDDKITRESIEKLSKKDADAYFAFYDWVGHIADIMGPMLMKTPPHVGSKKFGDIKDVVPARRGRFASTSTSRPSPTSRGCSR